MKLTIQFDNPFGKHEKIIRALKIPFNLEPLCSLINGLIKLSRQKSMMIIPIEIEIEKKDTVEKFGFLISTLSNSGSCVKKINDIDNVITAPQVNVLDNNTYIVKPRKWWRDFFKRK
jgi:hypothetical protein